MLRWLISLFSSHKRPQFPTIDEALLQTTKTGLQYMAVREPAAEGRQPRSYDQVRVRYAGWTADGKLFDASYPKTITFSLDRVIRGWSQGLQLMREGAEYVFVIPGKLAYGPRGIPPMIGPDATLIFHVELVKVVDLITA